MVGEIRTRNLLIRKSTLYPFGHLEVLPFLGFSCLKLGIIFNASVTTFENFHLRRCFYLSFFFSFFLFSLSLSLSSFFFFFSFFLSFFLSLSLTLSLSLLPFFFSLPSLSLSLSLVCEFHSDHGMTKFNCYHIVAIN